MAPIPKLPVAWPSPADPQVRPPSPREAVADCLRQLRGARGETAPETFHRGGELRQARGEAPVPRLGAPKVRDNEGSNQKTHVAHTATSRFSI